MMPLSTTNITTDSSIARVDVINYGGGNLGSLLRALKRCNIPYHVYEGKLAHQPTKPETDCFPSGDHPIVLPGVGAFGSVMHALNERGFTECLQRLVGEQKTPLLGVCVGQQVLFESSEESPSVVGLGLLKGQVKRFTSAPETPCKIPQIGWNSIHSQQTDSGFPSQGYVYYVNSYYAEPNDGTIVLYSSTYGGTRFCGAIRHQHITAFQFHPEKSGELGHTLLSQWWQAYAHPLTLTVSSIA
jgi:imidazole glycerol phosphate synthase glutamine amidotransferase subunit